MKNAFGNESLIFPLLIPDMGEKSKGNLRMAAWFAYLSKPSDFPSKVYQQFLFPTEIRVKVGLGAEKGTPW